MLSLDPPGLGTVPSSQEDAFVVESGITAEPMATIALDNGVLKVNGTAGDDLIDIKDSYVFHQVDINTVFKTPAIEATLRDADGNSLSTQKFSPYLINEIVVRAFAGDDTVNNATSLPSEIFGGFGNDNLYGGFGADIIWGEEGNDGLFGGDAENHNELHGGFGADRYLKMNGSPVNDIHDPDASTPIWFSNGTGETVDLIGYQEDATFESGSWSRDEIILVDQALAELHHITGNSKLLKAGGFAPISFIRHGAQTAGPPIRGLNNGSQIKLTDNAFTSGDARFMQTVFHEVGHNWDEESPFWNDFKELTGWVEANSKPTDNHVASTGEDDQWFYYNDPPTDTATFAREYGKQNPMEDFATSFAAHFMYRLGLPYDGDGAANIPQKNWLIHKLVSSMSEKSLGHVPSLNGLTTIDGQSNDQQQTEQYVQRRTPIINVLTPTDTTTSTRSDSRTGELLQTTSDADSNLARDAAFAELGDTLGNDVGQATRAFPETVTDLNSTPSLKART